MADSPEVMVEYYSSLREETKEPTRDEVQAIALRSYDDFSKHAAQKILDLYQQLEGAIDKKALTEWIRSAMDAMGTPPAYSYRVGIYHGMEKVLKQVEAGKFDVRGEEG